MRRARLIAVTCATTAALIGTSRPAAIGQAEFTATHQTPSMLVGQAVPVLAITNVNVIPVDRPGILANRTVLVRDGRIARMGSAGDVPVPAAARVIEGRGKYLVPGFADMHAHLWTPSSLRLLLANGVTTVREMNGQPLYLHWREQIRLGRLSGPRLALASPILEGTPPPEHAAVIDTTGRIIVDDSSGAASSVATFATQRYDFVKVYNNLSARTYRSIVAAARQRGLPVVGHVPFAVGLRGVFEAGQQTIEHLRGYVLESVPAGAPDRPGTDYRSRLIAWRHADTASLRALARETARRGVWNVPTLVTQLVLLPTDRIHELTERPAWKTCMLRGRADPVAARRRVPFYAPMTESDFVATQEGVTVQKTLVRMLHEEGAGILVGTDTRPRGYAFHWEMEELIDAGLSPQTVLRAATLDAARYLGQDSTSGSVTEGKLAELVLLSANPLDDIRNTRLIDAVYAGGRLLEAQELATVRQSACQALSG